jgi:hypothetical protein
MRGSESFDGKMAGNTQLVDRYNEAKGKKKGEKRQARPKETGGFSGGEHGPGGHDEIKQVVDEHGAAVHHAIHKTQQGYHSVTHHEDGHIHHADHDTLGEAHEHGAHAMGDTEHLGDMDKDDYQVAEEKDAMERGGSGSSGTSKVGFMS